MTKGHKVKRGEIFFLTLVKPEVLFRTDLDR